MARLKGVRVIAGIGWCTYLSPDKLCQRANELWCSVDAQFDGFFVNNFADGKPKGRLEALFEHVSRARFRNLEFL